MKFSTYDTQGVKLTSGSTNAVGGQSPTNGSTPMATYDKTTVGILSLQQQFPAADVYDFRVPGDPNKVTFQYKFDRAGYLLGVSFTGTVSTTIQGGIFVQKTDGQTGMQTDVMTPSDPGNTQTYDVTNFPKTGMLVMAPSPIAYNAGDLANMKFKNFLASGVTVNLAGFLIVGLMPQ